MRDPVLIQDNNKLWHCLWTLNDEDGAIAYASSNDLSYWKPQSYPPVFGGKGNCKAIEVSYNSQKRSYFISWVNTQNGKELYGTFTKDFKYFEPAQKLPNEIVRINQRDIIYINGKNMQVQFTKWIGI